MTLRQREPRIIDEAWLVLVRQMPCLICGYPRSDPAHLRAGARQYDKRECGMGEKPHDWWVIPLCRTHHREQHDRGDELAWWLSKGVADPHAIAIALYATRPPELRPLPAPAKTKKVRVRKQASERRKVGKSRPIPQRPDPWPKGRQIQPRPFQRKGFPSP